MVKAGMSSGSLGSVLEPENSPERASAWSFSEPFL